MGHTLSRLFHNPIAFTRWPVTSLILAVYIGLLAGLLTVHHSVPSAPSSNDLPSGINLTVAWDDLQYLASTFHPYNSATNDHIRDWLRARIVAILNGNGITYRKVNQRSSACSAPSALHSFADVDSPRVVIFNDIISNATFSSSEASRESVYFEGTNIIVYIKGLDDGPTSKWWKPDRKGESKPLPANKRGVLVNAHYDSISTGYGATDDGVGVATILQLVKHYTTKGNQPRRGLVALLNNGEEDYLNGARAFAEHPSSRFPDTFLNLEGAGAGGRAALFRSTDTEVTRSYQDSLYPFGTVVSADGFKRGLVRSGTDYSIFTKLGLRGLDVAFLEPRSMYHTTGDSSRRTSKDSVYHMLSAALATTKRLTSDTDTEYSSNRSSQAAYFDLFGRTFVVLSLDVLFALSITILLVGPIALVAAAVFLYRADKWYLFSVKITSNSLDPNAPDEPVDVPFRGWHGFFRFPVAFVLASLAVAALAILLIKVDPIIVYSSPYAVWSTFLIAWFAVAWLTLRGADYIRPSALHRAHALGWLFAISWVLLLAATIGEASIKIASGYLLFFFNGTAFLALLVSYLEFGALPTRSDHASSEIHDGTARDRDHPQHRPTSASSRRPRSTRDSGALNATTQASEDAEANETTSLLASHSRSHSRQPTKRAPKPYSGEQAWSAHLPSSLWLLQFLLLGPINIILLTQVALFLTSALSQTPADGSPVFTIYGSMALLSILILAPISPFIHRISGRVPAFLLLVLIGTVLYTTLAFPFSDRARLKVFFQQHIDLETGVNNVTLTGIEGYVQRVVHALPSASGKSIECTSDPGRALRPGLTTCTWHGLPPAVVVDAPGLNSTSALAGSWNASMTPTPENYTSWLTLTATRTSLDHDHDEQQQSATFNLSALNSRACKLLFDAPLADYNVSGAAAHDERFVKVPDEGTYELRLWSRTWGRTWSIDARLKPVSDRRDGGGQHREDAKGREAKKRPQFTGKAVCLWSDANDAATRIPALEEVWRYAPVWAGVSKAGDGLVEGFKGFELEL